MVQITVIMTRPLGSNSRFISRLADDVRAHLVVIESPLIEICPLPVELELDPAEAAIFSSGNAVDHAPPGNGRRAYCVGKRTTGAATEHGWDAICAGENADALVEYLSARRPKEPLHHLSGVHLRGDIAGRLRAEGFSVVQTALYDQRLMTLTEEALSAITGPEPVLVPLFSPRTAEQFAAWSAPRPGISVIAISHACADAMPASWHESLSVSATPDANSMAEAFEIQARKLCLA